jgi:cobalamin biosynthesis Mg chelatase CobN
LVISAIALIFAVGGGAFAIASSDNKKDKKIAKKVANKQIDKKAPNLSVKHAKKANHAKKAKTATNATNADHATSADSATSATTATDASHATSADSATSATSADSSQPTAFAHVKSGPGGAPPFTLDAANSKNVTTLVKPTGSATFCFSGISFDPRGGQAIVEGTAGTQYAQFGVGTKGGFCPAGTQAYVATLDLSGANSPAPFYVLFYK